MEELAELEEFGGNGIVLLALPLTFYAAMTLAPHITAHGEPPTQDMSALHFVVSGQMLTNA